MLAHWNTVENHVARRVVGRRLADDRAAFAAFEPVSGLDLPILSKRFLDGRKLTPAEAASVAGAIEHGIASMRPFHLSRTVRRASPGRPNGGSTEIFAVLGYASIVAGVEVLSLDATRAHVDRRRVILDSEFLGATVTRHFLERAVERGLVEGDDPVGDACRALLGYQGFLAAWRRAIGLGLVRVDHDLHLPYAEGLFMGTIYGTKVNPPARRRVAYRDCIHSPGPPLSGFRTQRLGDGPPAFLDWCGRTALPFSSLTPEQEGYRDEALVYADRWEALFSRIGREGMWTSPEDGAALRPEDVAVELDEAARDLAALVLSPRFASVYRDRRHLDCNPAFAGRLAA